MVATPNTPLTGLAPWVPERVRAHAPAVSLRDYQDDAVTAVAQAIGLQGTRRVVVVMATGGGKTVVFGALTHAWLAEGLGRVLILAHRDELISQAVAKLALWLPRHLIGVVKAEENATEAPVIVASVQTLRIGRRLEQVGQFGLIVIDECHHSAATSYKTILTDLGAFSDGGPAVVGVTATPTRGDGVGIADVFEEIVYRKTYTDLVAAGWLVPPRGKTFELIASKEKPQFGIDGDYAEGWLGRMMLGANAPDKILEAWQEHADDRPTIVFTPTVSVAVAVAEAFEAAGIPSAWVSGAMPLRERRAALEALRLGTVKVVANCAVLTEGFDEPSVSCIVVARPTRSQSFYIQMVGRGTRCLGQDIRESREAGKADVLILDMVGVAEQLTLDAVVELVGRKAPLLSEAAPRERPPEQGVEFATEDGRLVAREFQTHRARCRWVNLPEGWYALSMLADGWITVEPDDQGTWSVVRRPKRGTSTVEYTGLAVDLAKSVGERVATEKGSRGGLPMHQRAGWLDRPLSEKALAYGLRMGLPIAAATTAWEKTVLEAEREYRTRWRGGR